MTREKETENEKLYWIFLGVLFAFGVQIAYDYVGLLTDQTKKLVVSSVVLIVLFVIVLFWGRKIENQKKGKT